MQLFRKVCYSYQFCNKKVFYLSLFIISEFKKKYFLVIIYYPFFIICGNINNALNATYLTQHDNGTIIKFKIFILKAKKKIFKFPVLHKNCEYNFIENWNK